MSWIQGSNWGWDVHLLSVSICIICKATRVNEMLQRDRTSRENRRKDWTLFVWFSLTFSSSTLMIFFLIHFSKLEYIFVVGRPIKSASFLAQKKCFVLLLYHTLSDLTLTLWVSKFLRLNFLWSFLTLKKKQIWVWVRRDFIQKDYCNKKRQVLWEGKGDIAIGRPLPNARSRASHRTREDGFLLQKIVDEAEGNVVWKWAEYVVW